MPVPLVPFVVAAAANAPSNAAKLGLDFSARLMDGGEDERAARGEEEGGDAGIECLLDPIVEVDLESDQSELRSLDPSAQLCVPWTTGMWLLSYVPALVPDIGGDGDGRRAGVDNIAKGGRIEKISSSGFGGP